MSEMRLNKFLAQQGIASRRKADQLITAGEIRVNGKVVDSLGVKVNPQKDYVKVGGKLIGKAKGNEKVYVLFHKPKNVMVTKKDPEGRTTVFDLINDIPKSMFTVGRLDFETEGLLLLTNDGDLANELMHPKFGVPRLYEAKVKGVPDENTLKKLAKGMFINGERLRPSKVEVKRILDKNSWLEITVMEGKNRQIRDMCAYAGHPVSKLKRTAYGNIVLGKLPVGASRRMSYEEIASLRKYLRALERKRPSRLT